jgi:hypothetical protein
MIMIVHHTIGMAQPRIPIHHVGKHRQEAPPVVIIGYDSLARIAPTGHVIDGVREREAERTGHGSRG